MGPGTALGTPSVCFRRFEMDSQPQLPAQWSGCPGGTPPPVPNPEFPTISSHQAQPCPHPPRCLWGRLASSCTPPLRCHPHSPAEPRQPHSHTRAALRAQSPGSPTRESATGLAGSEPRVSRTGPKGGQLLGDAARLGWGDQTARGFFFIRFFFKPGTRPLVHLFF